MGMVQSQVLNDKDIAQDLLTSEKYVTTLVGTGTLEASNPHVRNTLSQIHHEMESNSRRIFEYLNARGWYNPRVADMQAVSDLRRSVDEAHHDIQRSFSGVGAGVGQVQSPVGNVGTYGGQQGYGVGAYQTAGYGNVGGGYQASGYGTNLPSWAYHEIGRTGQQGGYGTGGTYGGGGGYGGGGYGTGGYGGGGYQAGGYGTTLPSWAYSEPPRREDRGGYGFGGQQGGGFGGGYGGGYQAGGYGYGGGYQAGQYGTNLPSWAYSEPPRREDRGGYGFGGQQGGYQGGYGTGGFGGGYQAGNYGYGGGYQAGQHGTNLPSWAYSDPPRREDRGGYGFGGQQGGGFGGGYGGRYA